MLMELFIIVANPQSFASLWIPQYWRSGNGGWWVVANARAHFLPHWNF